MAEGGELKAFMVILLIISAFVMAIAPFTADMGSYYNVSSDQTLQSGDVYYGNTSGHIEEIQSDLETEEIEGSEGQDNLLAAAYSAMVRVYRSIATVGDLINDLSKAMNIPEQYSGVVAIFITIVTIVILLAIYGVVTRTRSP